MVNAVTHLGMLFFCSQDWLGREHYHQRQPRQWDKIRKDRIPDTHFPSFKKVSDQSNKQPDKQTSCFILKLHNLIHHATATCYYILVVRKADAFTRCNKAEIFQKCTTLIPIKSLSFLCFPLNNTCDLLFFKGLLQSWKKIKDPSS